MSFHLWSIFLLYLILLLSGEDKQYEDDFSSMSEKDGHEEEDDEEEVEEEVEEDIEEDLGDISADDLLNSSASGVGLFCVFIFILI